MSPRIFIAIVFSLAFWGCAPARPPVPPGVIPEPQPPTVDDEQYGHTILNQLQERYQVDYNNPQLDRIQTIVDRLAKAAHADQDPWHVYLFKDDNFKNAGATRGNHVFIWTGMLDSTHSDGELAAVIAHEMGHVLARHTDPDPNEELRKMLIQVGALAAGIAVAQTTRVPYIDLGQVTSTVTQSVGEGILSNPFSQDLEYEADQIGLMLMAEAKFDPQEALNFWERAETDPDMNSSIPFLSTHPPAANRLQRLQQLMPLAMNRFHGSQVNDSTSDVKQSQAPSAESQNSKTKFPKSKDRSSRSGDSLYGASPQGQDQEPPKGGDTFDLSDTPRERERNPKSPELDYKTSWADTWKVISSRAILFEEPSSDSKQLGELRFGAEVQALGRNHGWLRVRTPEHGFLRESELAPVYPAATTKPTK